MDFLLAMLALALPTLLGGLWLRQFVPASSVARAPLVWGNGALLGLLLVPQLMRGLDAFGIALTALSIGSLIATLIALALVTQFIGSRRAQSIPVPRSYAATIPASHRALFIFLLSLVVLRVTTLGLEIIWRPLFPWDATMHWATKTRVWFEYNSIATFVSTDAWLEMGGADVFTDFQPHYPAAVPLLQVWMNLVLGRWDESLMNLPWLLCLIALGSAFYGQQRALGIGQLIAMTFTYLLLSMPLLNIHVALAGYADLFLGAAYCASLMAFHNWFNTRQRWQGLLALFFALSCPLIKDEGLVWLLTYVPALMFILMPRGEALRLCVLFSLLICLLWLVLPGLGIALQFTSKGTTTLWTLLSPDMEIAGQRLDRLAVGFHTRGLRGLVESVWLHDNWHLLGYLLLAILPLGLLMPGAMTRSSLPLRAALSAAVMAFLFLFLLTGFGEAAADYTGVGRLSIQLAPGLLYLCALLCHELFDKNRLQVETLTQKL
jgi:hypothetical protein